MKYLIRNHLNVIKSNANSLPSIQELKDFQVLKRKNALSKSFRKYVTELNKKQNKWLRNNLNI